MRTARATVFLLGCWVQFVLGWEHIAPDDFREAVAGDDVLVACMFLSSFSGISYLMTTTTTTTIADAV